MPKLPNKMIQAAYDAAVGKIFTWSPTYQRFTDADGISDYDYHAMCWLKDNGYMLENFDKNNFVYLFRIK